MWSDNEFSSGPTSSKSFNRSARNRFACWNSALVAARRDWRESVKPFHPRRNACKWLVLSAVSVRKKKRNRHLFQEASPVATPFLELTLGSSPAGAVA
jgi:hypothetical protein